MGRPFRDLASGILEADAAGGEAADCSVRAGRADPAAPPAVVAARVLAELASTKKFSASTENRASKLVGRGYITLAWAW